MIGIAAFVTMLPARRDQRCVRLTCRAGRRNTELALERGNARLVDGERTSAVASCMVQLEEESVCVFTEWLALHQTLGVGDRLGVVATFGK